ncbi:glucose-6-phosphate exchanger SLC37A2 isoform X2 [Bemisia tabaci]|uniref:glucose-6-phosphate exchanger SLC37A2 isoform X2 n=1 Tax=Bemisia tabaci TaxID=7038 RepID=UPI0008F98F56|nr:PREDICTED: glucose-6-phosphate exchanger SLC37A2 isoform X2 [Bemisia tabaci]
MSMQSRNLPVGVRVVLGISRKCCARVSFNRNVLNQSLVFFLTFMSYTFYHAARKPISVVKNVLNQNCSNLIPPTNTTDDNWCDWAPFDGPNVKVLLGYLDSSFLFSYAIAMFFSGFIAERVNLRYYLSTGMILSGLSCILFGLAYENQIHSLTYFIIVQMFGGIVQTTGWPGVVTVMDNWFGKGKKGFIFGVWNSHTSVGNIVGTLIASRFVETNWGLSFIAPGALIAIGGVLVFLFLIPDPKDTGCNIPTSPITRKNLQPQTNGKVRTEGSPILSNMPDKPVGFFKALVIPGVMEYSLCLFFAKLVSYTFLYWLPRYIKSSTTLSASTSADVSTFFDVGGIFGGIIAGALSDSTNMSATTCLFMLLLAVPSLYLYDVPVVFENQIILTGLLLVSGALVNGPYALITTAISADLGSQHSSRALATVTAIIDGTGSIGAALGPLLAGLVGNWFGWISVFYMLMLSNTFAILLLSRLVWNEWKHFCNTRRID